MPLQVQGWKVWETDHLFAASHDLQQATTDASNVQERLPGTI
jgi:hypothetical protein